MARNIVVLGITLLTSALLSGQVDGKSDRAAEIELLTASRGANAWRQKGIDVDKQGDNVATQVRVARNSYWEHHLPRPDGSGPRGLSPAGGNEVDPTPNHAWLIGEFTAFHVYKPSEKGGAYTEIQLRVKDVISNDTSAKISADMIIDIGEVGGAIKEPDGTLHSYNLSYNRFPMQPRHFYLVQLSYVAFGDFYLVDRKWDITSGKALPDGEKEAEQYMEGRSRIGGLSVSEAIGKASVIARGRR